ncbi:DUF2865 domain-containing protein [Phreatobacter aquaticus]|uniref:DUF2865 domain-containing protein n=1 Tax=Phreatobacter aquaticus TaxID=2570229 RepID=A0A4D7QQ26_9HYPH|nr:DUF2865 domain-containing protein [Phreatobacter aquaticus]QCK88083.1 DUF2865 domain-containing protein [Phreatobacter aquaticus]
MRLRHCLALLLPLCLMAGPASAQDSDQIYAIIHQDAAARAARQAARQTVQPAQRLPQQHRLAAAPQQMRGATPHFSSLFSRPVALPVGLPMITIRPPVDGMPGLDGQPGQVAPQPALPQQTAPRSVRPTAPSAPQHGGATAYCVRSCDGYYFPVGPAQSGGSRQAQDMTCNALCPGADVALYRTHNGGTIETAAGPRGQVYQSLRNAFRFREKFDATCTCSGLGATGLGRVAITNDFTLRSGDIVVTERGVRIFAGASRFPYRPSDFVAARAYSRLPADVHHRIAMIEAGIQAQENTSSAPAARLATGRRRAGMPVVDAQAQNVAQPSFVANNAGPRVIQITR